MLNQNLLFSTQNLPPNSGSAVNVYFRNINIGSITGPQPFVSISKTYNKNNNEVVESVNHSIELQGKILSTNKSAIETNGATGFSGIMQSISQLENLFDCPYGSFEIVCNDQSLYSITGVIVNNLNINNTPDNWTQSADYNIGLEFITQISGMDPVRDMSESWTIEPQEDLSYMNKFYGINGNAEDPPGYGAFSPSVGSTNSILSAINGPRKMGSASADITVIPQYRISRRLSAKGLNANINIDCENPQNNIDKRNIAFLNAKSWVEKQLKKPFNNEYKNNGLLYFPGSTSGTALYNHARTTSIDLYNGTYEVNDTWLAMPEKIGYIETFTIDRSTSEEYVTTVRIAGNIQGLIETPLPIMDGTSGVLPTGVTSNNPIDLSYTEYDGVSSSDFGVINNHLAPKSTKYDSAASGWIQKIKPILYRRACLVVNSNDRQSEYNDANPNIQTTHPNYSTESLLNIIPSATSENHDPHKGTVSYNYEFNNRNRMLGSVYNGVLSENVSITVDNPSDSTSEISVIGRYLGPIIQSNSRTSARKTINIDIVIVPPSTTKESVQTDPSCPLYRNNTLWQTIDRLIEGHRPYGDRTNELFDFSPSQQQGVVFSQSDQESWNPTQGRYSRSVSWIFQQCNITRHHMDH